MWLLSTAYLIQAQANLFALIQQAVLSSALDRDEDDTVLPIFHHPGEAALAFLYKQFARLFVPFDRYESILVAFVGITITCVLVKDNSCVRASVDAEFVGGISVFIDKLHRLRHWHDRSRSHKHGNEIERSLRDSRLTAVIQPATPEIEPLSARWQVDFACLSNI